MLRQLLIFVIALILAAIVWWIGPLISIGVFQPLSSVWIRLIIVTLFLIWGLWGLILFVLDKLSRLKVRRGPAPRQADRVATRIADALRTLRHVGMAAQRNFWLRWRYRLARGYVNERPWYLVMGAEGGGKSALIRASGQRFILSEQYGLPMTVDTDATVDCNLWLTDQAVYVDTAGSCIGLNGMSNEQLSIWRTILRSLRRVRRFPQVDGIVLCVDISAFAKMSMDARKLLADSLRARVLETASWFKNDLPIYLLLNKLDLLPGGATFMGTITDEALAKGIGFTLPLETETLLDAIDKNFREVEALLHLQGLDALYTITNERTDAARNDILIFMEQLGALRPPLLSFIEQLFPQSPMSFCGRLRSVWFGSAAEVIAQGDFPSSRFNGQSVAERKSLGKSYGRIFQLAVQERGVARFSNVGVWRKSAGRLSAYAALTLLLCCGIWLLGVNYFWEKNYIASAWANFKEVQRLSNNPMATTSPRSPLLEIADQLRPMAILLPDVPGFTDTVSPTANPYFEHRLITETVKKKYRRQLITLFWPELQRYVAKAVADDIATQSTNLYETLKIYLMLANPGRRNPQDLIAWFSPRWQLLGSSGGDEIDRTLFNYHLRSLFSIPEKELAPANIDSKLLREARIKAANLPLTTRVLARIKLMPLPTGVDDVSLSSAAGQNASLALRRGGEATATDVAVPGIFTKDGYNTVFLPQLRGIAQDVQQEGQWVLNNESNTNVSNTTTLKLAAEAQQLYLQQYADSWDAFLGDIRIRQVASLDDAATLANQFADPASPLLKLLRFSAHQTTLAAGADSSLEQAGSKLEKQKNTLIQRLSGERSNGPGIAEKIVDQRFEGLRRLALQSSQEQGGSDTLSKLFSELSNRLSTLANILRSEKIMPQSDWMSTMRSDAERQPEPVKKIVNELIRIGSTQSIKQSRDQIKMGASGIGSGACSRTIAGRYPFSRSAKNDVGIDDFVKMFSRSGTLQSYFDKNIAEYVDTNAHPWRARSSNDASQSVVNESTLKTFENAAKIRDVFFGSNDQPAFSMIVRPLDLDPSLLDATLDIDGQVLQYSHGPQQPMRVLWPGPKGGVYVRLSLRKLNNELQTMNFDGAWALFHFFDSAQKSTDTGDSRDLSIASDAGKFRFEIRSSKQDFPLWSNAISQFRCPS